MIINTINVAIFIIFDLISYYTLNLNSPSLYDAKISVKLKYIGNVFIFEVRNPVAEKILNSLNGLFKIECTDLEFIANVYIITEEVSHLC